MESYSPDHVEVREVKTQAIKTTFSMPKVLLWMGLGLLVTAVVSLCLPDLLWAITGGDPGSLYSGYITIYVLSVLIMLPCSLIVSLKAFSNKKVGITIAYFLYSIAIGMLLSTIFMQVLAIEPNNALRLISLSFFITAGCFLLMGGVGALTKKSLGGIVPFLSTFVIGHVRRLVESRQFESSYSMTIYCAFTLYVDFINIFLRILYYVLLLFGRRDN